MIKEFSYKIYNNPSSNFNSPPLFFLSLLLFFLLFSTHCQFLFLLGQSDFEILLILFDG